MIFHLSKEFERAGVKSPIYSTDMLCSPGEQVHEGVSIHRFPHTFPWMGLDAEAKNQLALKGGSPLSWRLFASLLTTPNLSVIHSHVQNRLGGIARTAALLRGIPYVVTIHGGWLTLAAEQSKEMQSPTQGKLEWGKAFGLLLGSRKTLSHADGIICVGEDEFHAMKNKFPQKPIYHLPNGVETAPFEQADSQLFRQRYGIKKEAYLISCISRIDPQKNQQLLLRTFAQLATQYPNWELAFIGPTTVPDYQRALVEQTRQLGLAHRVHFIPGLPPGDHLLPSAFKGSDLFVLPSRHEPFGIVILEAWAASTPVIAASVGGIPGFTTHQDNLLLFSDNQQEELASLLVQAYTSPPLTRKLIEGGKKTVQGYEWSAISERTLEIYQELIQRKKEGAFPL